MSKLSDLRKSVLDLLTLPTTERKIDSLVYNGMRQNVAECVVGSKAMQAYDPTFQSLGIVSFRKSIPR